MSNNTKIRYFVLSDPPPSEVDLHGPDPVVMDVCGTLAEARKSARECQYGDPFIVRTFGQQPLGGASPPLFQEIMAGAALAAEILADPDASADATMLAELVLNCKHALTMPKRLSMPTVVATTEEVS